MAKLKVLRNARGSKWCSVCFMGCSWLTTFKLEQSRSTSFTSCVLCLTIGITIGKSYWYHNWCRNLQMHWGSSGCCSKASRTGHVPGLALEKFCSSSQLCTVVHSSRPRFFFKETASVQVFAQAHFFSKALCGTLIFQQVPHQIVDLKFIGVVWRHVTACVQFLLGMLFW